MSSSKPGGKQRLTIGIPHTSERRQTRRFAKENRIQVPNLSLEDLEAITRKSRALKRRPHPSLPRSKSQLSKTRETTKTRSKRYIKPKSVTEHKAETGRSQPGVTVKSKSKSKTISNKSRTRKPQASTLGQTDRPRTRPQLRSTTAQPGPIDRPLNRESQGLTLVSSWLNLTSQIDPIDPEEPDTPSNRPYSMDLGRMDTPSSNNASSTNENGVAPSTKASTVKKATATTFMEHLEFRGITDVKSQDNLLLVRGIMDKLAQNSSVIKRRQLGSLVKILYESAQAIEGSIDEAASEDGFLLYDSLREKILDWIPDTAEYRRFPPVCARHFDWDRHHCDNSNEADFQRTIMIEIIDRYDFKDTFAFSCEEAWSVDSQFLIQPSRKNSVIKQPKPDLAISFQRNMIKKSGRLDYPIELKSCLHPGSKGRQRWFPFLFLEAKRDVSSLRDAFESNLLNASQALSNIYQWMRQIPDLERKFFDEVRVMTITLNNRDLTLRMHRAEKTEKDYLQFEYTEVQELLRYNRFDACHLIKGVLVDFAIPHLLPILADTYDRVSKLETRRNEPRKRKQPAPRDGGIAQDDGSLTTVSIDHESTREQPDPSTGNSFAMESMGVSAPPADFRPDSAADNAPKRNRRGKRTPAGSSNR